MESDHLLVIMTISDKIKAPINKSYNSKNQARSKPKMSGKTWQKFVLSSGSKLGKFVFL